MARLSNINVCLISLNREARREEQLYHLFFSACHVFEGIVDHCCTTVIRNIVNTSPRAQYRRLKSNEAKLNKYKYITNYLMSVKIHGDRLEQQVSMARQPAINIIALTAMIKEFHNIHLFLKTFQHF